MRVLGCEARHMGEVLIKALRRFLLSLMTRYSDSSKYTYGDCGNFLVSEAVILVRRSELVTLCGFFISTNKNPV